MITELRTQEFYKIKHLTDPCNNIEVRAVAEGINPGRVYIDHPDEPEAALIWIQGQSDFQIVGNPRSQGFLQGLDSYMRTYLEPELVKQNIHGVEIVPENREWGETIRAIFHPRHLSHDIQYVFGLIEDNVPPALEAVLSSPLIITRMDKETLRPGRYKNYAFLEHKILHYWNSIEEFLQHGIGYIAECNEKVASVCFSGFVAGSTHAADVETVEEFRGQYYAAGAVRAFVKECCRCNFQPYWDCSRDNMGSIRLAEGAGLSLDFSYPIFWYNLAPSKEESEFMEIHGEQVLLSSLAVDDLDFMSSTLCNKNLWYYEESVEENKAEVREKYRSRIQDAGNKDHYDFVIRRATDPERTPIGIIKLWSYVGFRSSWELGYALLPEYSGNGYGIEAVRLLLQFAFEQLKAHKVVGMCNSHNERSAALMERSGMVREGVFKEELNWQGRWVDQYFYAILEKEFIHS
ncbi:GNAT family N-acetyltransferase [Paenibacillus sp. NPDC056722]|uniref:GNAT family N-acetyltransferase n=1 Tax=Paenibacillus sp. NPDC056722 TaxID=3345924 RepID=UPI0036B8A8E3